MSVVYCEFVIFLVLNGRGILVGMNWGVLMSGVIVSSLYFLFI